MYTVVIYKGIYLVPILRMFGEGETQEVAGEHDDKTLLC